VSLPGWRIEDALRRTLASAPPMVFPGAGPAQAATRERDWWRSVVRSTFLAADSSSRFPDFDAFFDDLYRVFSRAGSWRCRAGCREALEELSRLGIARAVVSNFDQRLPDLLDDLGLTPLLDATVLPFEVGAAKPDRRIFDFALARLGAAPGRSVFVGDSPDRDLAAARAAGIRAIDVASLATLAELPARLAGLAGANRANGDA
jgi:putative hydrolase of the HAD superfamily